MDSTPEITLEELSKHNNINDCWIAIEGKVYNVTKWIAAHPGGEITIVDMAGQDATDVFTAFHPARVAKLLPKYFVGNLVGVEVLPVVLEHRQLRKQLEEAGFFETDFSFYYKLFSVLVPLFGLVVAGVVLTSSVAIHMLCAVVLGMLWNQSMLIGHDTGHNSITKNRMIDSYIGLFCGNIFTGVGIQWWKSEHNVHHITCNSIDYDPDVQHIPVFALNAKFFSSRYSLFHMREMTFDRVAAFLVQYQHLTFYPIMIVARINLYFQTLILLVRGKNIPWRKRELMGLVIFWTWFGALLSALPSLVERAAFASICFAVGGILHDQICLSHFPMPTFEGRPKNDTFVVTQLNHTLNIDCPTWLDWFHGGLQFQVEHHLFPRMPRHNLRKVKGIVQAFCKKHGLNYHSATFTEANKMVIRALHSAAMEARKLTSPGAGFEKSMLWDMMNARG
eukprot:TRINITY_DN1486_c0_g3_i1.p1 TRINITY_DN1486_c0_g3~~TRINITY_DN1486_c0_g3_i1.p1  ORF type:complete len:479 (+),score=68.99 TRINITY_DN1486_c0_g3_i1:93-1439(+)